MNNIIVAYDPFALESKVTVIHDDLNEQVSIASDIESLSQNLVALAYKYDIYDIKAHAPFAVTSEIKRQVNMLESKNYSENKITVEGI